jgi:cobaltochelatase CobS
MSVMADLPNVQADSRTATIMAAPDRMASVRDLFGIDSDMEVPAFSEADERVPISTRLCVRSGYHARDLRGLCQNRRVMVQGYHGTGKSTHIEQVAARLNWPCIRINLDAHISRIDLVGRDAIVLRDGLQVTEFSEGCCPGRCRRRPRSCSTNMMPAARRDVRDPARAGDRGQAHPARPEPGDPPEPYFRCSRPPTRSAWRHHGLYHGTQQINQGQMDRWNIVVTLNYPAGRDRGADRAREIGRI